MRLEVAVCDGGAGACVSGLPSTTAPLEKLSTDWTWAHSRIHLVDHDVRMKPGRLPADLPPRFSVAQARALGVTPARLRGSDLARPFRGVRATGDAVADGRADRSGLHRGEREQEHIERARRYAVALDQNGFFSHVTAAAVWGIPLPPAALQDGRIDVAVAGPHRLRRARGIHGHEVVAAATRVVRHPGSGLLVTDPATTWAMLGAALRDPYDLVAAGDAVVRTWRVDTLLARIDDLERVLSRGRRVGIVALRLALPRLRERSASRPESHLRLLIIDHGMPEPEVNIEIRRDGLYFGAVDLVYRHQKIAIEYEGEHHRLSAEQWARDIARYDRLRAEGWIVIRVTKVDLFDRPYEVAARVRAALRARQ